MLRKVRMASRIEDGDAGFLQGLESESVVDKLETTLTAP